MREIINTAAMLTCFAVISFVSIWWGVPALAGLTFDHEFHQRQIGTEDCSVCHLEGAQQIVPQQQVCLSCHDSDFIQNVAIPAPTTHGPLWGGNHRLVAKSINIDCAGCHQQSDCLECHKAGFADEMGDFGNALANVHRSDFQVTHPIAARTDPQLCSSCHEDRFCSDCHDAFAPEDLAVASHRRGFSDGTLGGAHAGFDDSQCATCHSDAVLPSHEWSSQHAREARKNLATCQACHPDGETCLKCHSALSGLGANPHPANWDDIAGRLEGASGGRTCRRCH